MLEFKSDQVSLLKNDGTEVRGMQAKYNKKTVTVITRDGQQWNVSPCFLTTAHKTYKERAWVKYKSLYLCYQSSL